MIYLQLFWEFFKAGLFAIGGGLATLPFLSDIAARCGWFTTEELADMVAVAESTPGPIGVNMATFAGITTAGLGGALVATVSEVLPSLIITLIITIFLTKFRENDIVKSTMRIIRPVSVGLIGSAVFSILKAAIIHIERYANGNFLHIFSWKEVIIFAGLSVLAWGYKKIHPIAIILLGGALGLLLKL